MAKAIDLQGLRFGKLVVISRSDSYSDGHAMWLCQCDCGKKTSVQSNNLRKKTGGTKSCGCLIGEAAREKNKKNGPWNMGTEYDTNKTEYKNKRWWAIKVKKIHGNSCMICGWSKADCDVHHKIQRKNGGKNTIENAIVLCPNCHREIHCNGNEIS